jgi:hypothetical protein
MKVLCTKCNRSFRDNFGLARHNNKKFPCVFIVPPTIQPTESNIIPTILAFGKEDTSIFNIHEFLNDWRVKYRIIPDPYVLAGSLIIMFHDLIKDVDINQNIKLTSPKAISASILCENNKWKQYPVVEVVDKVLRVRAGQLCRFKDQINEINNKVFDNPVNRMIWKHIEKFAEIGVAHQTDVLSQIRNLKTAIKVALLN